MTLPVDWRERVPQRHQRLVELVEWVVDRGGIDLLVMSGAAHEKGYPRVWLPPHHPYAQPSRPAGNGTQTLHRYLVMRREGRVLEPEEHVHHPHGVPKDARDPESFELMHAVEHGRFHWGAWEGCGAHVYDCPDCGGRGCTACDGRGAIEEPSVHVVG